MSDDRAYELLVRHLEQAIDRQHQAITAMQAETAQNREILAILRETIRAMESVLTDLHSEIHGDERRAPLAVIVERFVARFSEIERRLTVVDKFVDSVHAHQEQEIRDERAAKQTAWDRAWAMLTECMPLFLGLLGAGLWTGGAALVKLLWP